VRLGKFKFGDAKFGRSLEVSSVEVPEATYSSPVKMWYESEKIQYTEYVHGSDGTHWINNVTRAIDGSAASAHQRGATMAPQDGTMLQTALAHGGLYVYRLEAGRSVYQRVPNALPEHHYGVFSVYARTESSDNATILLLYKVGDGGWQKIDTVHRISPHGVADTSNVVPQKGGWHRYYGTIMRQEGTPDIHVRITAADGEIYIDDAKLEICPVYSRGRVTAGISSTTWQDNTKNWRSGELIDRRLVVVAGTGKGETRLITANTSTTFTLGTGDGTLTLDTTSEYYITDRYVNNMPPTPYVEDWQSSLWMSNLNAVNIRTGTLSIGGKDVPTPYPRLSVFDADDNEIVTIGDNLSDVVPRGIRLRQGAGLLIYDDGFVLIGTSSDSGTVKRSKLSKYGLQIFNPDGSETLASHDLETDEIIRVGSLRGINTDAWGELSGFGIYMSGNAYFEGDINVTGDSRVAGTIATGSPLGPSTFMGRWAESGNDLHGMWMRSETGLLWWQSYYDPDNRKVYWEVRDPTKPGERPLASLVKRMPTEYEASIFGDYEQYFFEIDAKSLHGTIIANHVTVRGYLSAAVGDFGVIDTGALILSGQSYGEGDFSGFAAWDKTNASVYWGDTFPDTRGFEFWHGGTRQGRWNYDLGAMTWGPNDDTRLSSTGLDFLSSGNSSGSQERSISWVRANDRSKRVADVYGSYYSDAESGISIHELHQVVTETPTGEGLEPWNFLYMGFRGSDGTIYNAMQFVKATGSANISWTVDETLVQNIRMSGFYLENQQWRFRLPLHVDNSLISGGPLGNLADREMSVGLVDDYLVVAFGVKDSDDVIQTNYLGFDPATNRIMVKSGSGGWRYVATTAL